MKVMNVDAFEAMIEPYLGGLYAFACACAGAPDQAEEIVHATVLRAWDHVESLRDHARVRPWLYSILLGICDESALEVTLGRRPSPGGVSAEDAVDSLHVALERVPASYAVVLELRDREGLTYGEIALVLDVPRRTVMSRIARGRAILAASVLERKRRGPDPSEDHHG